METNDKNLGDKKWNNEQQVNEGFSGKNLPEDYNKGNHHMTSEIETDQFGHETEVMRARFPHQADEKYLFDEAIENKESLENRDLNYDMSTDRYPHSHPDNHKDRGNMNLDQ